MQNGEKLQNGSSNGSILLDEESLTNSSSIRTTLTIKSSQLEKSAAGKFACVFSNRFGEAKKEFKLFGINQTQAFDTDKPQNATDSSFSFDDPSGIAAVSSLAAITVIILLVGLAGFLVYVFKVII